MSIFTINSVTSIKNTYIESAPHQDTSSSLEKYLSDIGGAKGKIYCSYKNNFLTLTEMQFKITNNGISFLLFGFARK